jgi:hypothetical protein
MKYVGLTLGLLLLAFLIYVATGKSLAIDEELAKLTPGDRQALDALLADSGLVASKLRAVEMRALKYPSKGLVVQDGRVVGLHLGEVPLKHLDKVVALTGLQELWLNDNGLTSVPPLSALTALQRLDLGRNQLREVAGLAGLPALQRLRLGRNALTSVAGLRELPALTELDLADNELTELAPLTALPALTTLDVTGNPLTALPSPLPARWKVKSDVEAAPAPPRPTPPGYPASWVDRLPKGKGKYHELAINGTLRSGPFQVTLTAQSLSGVVRPWNLWGSADSNGWDTTLELAVTQGRVRAYLHYLPPSDKLVKTTDGFIFAEAEPGKPAKIKGVIESWRGGYADDGKEYDLLLETVGGEAQGVTLKLSR